VQHISTTQNIATETMAAARAATQQREKSMIEQIDEWQYAYREANSPMNTAKMQPGYMAEHQAALLQAMATSLLPNLCVLFCESSNRYGCSDRACVFGVTEADAAPEEKYNR
jgi:hypothetical protein